MRQIIFPILFGVLLLTVTACRSPDTDRVPSKEQLADAYAGLLIIREQFKSSTPRATAAAYDSTVTEFLKEFNLTKDEFRSQVGAITSSKDGFRRFFQTVSDALVAQTTKSEI